VPNAPDEGRWWTIANGVRVDPRDRERLAQLIYEAIADERERCANIVGTRASAIARAVDKFPPSSSGIVEAAKIRLEALTDAARAIRKTAKG